MLAPSQHRARQRPNTALISGARFAPGRIWWFRRQSVEGVGVREVARGGCEGVRRQHRGTGWEESGGVPILQVWRMTRFSDR